MSWSNGTAQVHDAARLPRFANEREARAWFEALLRPSCAFLVPEVWISHPLHPRNLRVDFVGGIRSFRPRAPGATLVALEAKDGRGGWQQWCTALAQGAAYRYGRIADKRATVHAGAQPSFCFVWPDPRDSPDWRPDGYAGWLDGAERVLGRMNVGTVRYRIDWRTGQPELIFTVSAAPLFSTLYGARGPVAFGTHPQIGAR